MARRDLLGEESRADREAILDGPMVRRLLAGQKSDGGFGGHPYRKWSGAHWRLVSLVELEVPPGEPRAAAAAERVLRWLTIGGTRTRTEPRGDPPRSDASIEGNAVAACTRLGLASDPRVRLLADALVAWQWPDGGWNCDGAASGRRSSFHETHATMWGLHEYATATGDAAAAEAARRAAKLFLEHRIFRRHGTGKPIHPSWVVLHYPPYWHYDILQALHLLRRMGLAGDPRAADALDVLESRRLPDGRWRPGAYWWSPPGSERATPEVVDWGRGQPSEMLTLNALRVLKAAGRSAAAAAA
ncbi:MAG: hypothetical protein EHM90_01100 [Chloroflexi bacterium]|nr:MAG: hypothetical protein EHM90_01100 [Chloroflexota bacterium]